MKNYMLCHKCGKKSEIRKVAKCPECGGILTVEYMDEYLDSIAEDLKKKEKQTMWDFREVMPDISEKNVVTFREGCTPLVKSTEIAADFGMKELYMKDETKNPTGSFKDRSVSVCVSMAKELNCPGVVVSSSGNGGAATGAYGVKGNVDTIIFVPEKTPVGKVAQAICYGGDVIKVRGNFSYSYNAAVAMAEQKNYMNVTTTYLSPFGLEGYKTIAYEIIDDLKKAPDFIFIPEVAGPVLYGVYKGFEEMRKMKWVEKIPRLICCQAKGCAPISEAWMENRKTVSCKDPKTIASAISDPLAGYEDDGDITVETIRKSNGIALAIEDEKILEAGRMLARKDGFFVEASSAASLAGLKELMERGEVGKDDCCVCLLTGHGLKDSAAYVPENLEIPVINTIEDL